MMQPTHRISDAYSVTTLNPSRARAFSEVVQVTDNPSPRAPTSVARAPNRARAQSRTATLGDALNALRGAAPHTAPLFVQPIDVLDRGGKR